MRELPYGNDRLTSKSNAADTRKKQKGGIAQLARASALQAEGRRFDSDYLHKIKTSFGRLFFCGDILRPPVAMRQPPGAYRCRLRRHRASPSSVFDENSVPPMRGCSRFCCPSGVFFLWRYPSTPSRYATAPRGIPLSSSTPSGISVLRFPLVQIIEHADWPYSGVELHFSCSMRSKWRHRASLSALQPPGTPLALLDELHEERFARRTIRTRDDAEEGSREKRRERQNAEKNTKGKTRRSLLELESVKIRLDRLTLCRPCKG